MPFMDYFHGQEQNPNISNDNTMDMFVWNYHGIRAYSVIPGSARHAPGPKFRNRTRL